MRQLLVLICGGLGSITYALYAYSNAESVENYIFNETGQDSTSCGVFHKDSGPYQYVTVTLSESSQILVDTPVLSELDKIHVSRCITAAYRKSRPFYFYFGGPGTDSYIAVGLLSTPAGVIKRFKYDSAPCGGEHCKPSIKLVVCSVPESDKAIKQTIQCSE